MVSFYDIFQDLLDLPTGQRATIVSLILLLVGFLIYHYGSEALKNRLKKKHKSPEMSTYYSYTLQRLIGFFALGLFPVLIFRFFTCKPLWYYGLNLNNLSTSLLWVAILGGLILIGNFFVAGSKENLEQYPQIRISNWSYKSLAVSSITWVLYLTGYEVMFRGLLLFSVYHEFGINTAISLNVLLYALVHLPKGKRETIGSVPLGFILCVLAIHTGSFLVPLLFHIIMALSNDYFAIRKNPDMRIKT